jgi:prepilin peptidase CpaA
MDVLTLALLSILPALVIVAGLMDLTTMRIPNWISGALIVAFFPVALIVGLPLGTVGLHALIAVAALLLGMALFALRIIGGGDAKLMAAACLWLGLVGSGMFLLWTGVVGGFFCLGILIARAYLAPYLRGAPPWVATLMSPRGDIPYGVAICAGALMAFPSSAMLAVAAAV